MQDGCDLSVIMKFTKTHDLGKDRSEDVIITHRDLLLYQSADAHLPAAVTDLEHRSLFLALTAVFDSRDPRGRRYRLASILVVAV
ncbi:hypothetical protein [Micromonospora sp. NPDC050276]|uniref:hypothetical protein n=1 Tax=Micromonospora sp. NPDC050276 TaxID=3364278 RepID=UPI00379FD6DB